MKEVKNLDGNIKAAMMDIGEKRSICRMCQNHQCPQERKDAFQKDYKVRHCPEFKYERRKKILY